MAAKNQATAANISDELLCHNDAVSLSLLINRRTRTLRIVDFRAGPSPAKRAFIMSVAAREGIEKAYTLVERDEVPTWTRLGFAREGTIPAFYKRSDAYLLGAKVESRANASGVFRASIPITEGPLGVLPTESDDTVSAAKRLAKDLAIKALPAGKLTSIDAAAARKHVASALKNQTALTTFAPFGRDVERWYFSISGRGGWEMVASVETQRCFGNAFLELLTGPEGPEERLATASAIKLVCDRLVKEGIVSVFALADGEDLDLSTAFAMNGFRKTGLLTGHLVAERHRRDAIVWSRKLVTVVDD